MLDPSLQLDFLINIFKNTLNTDSVEEAGQVIKQVLVCIVIKMSGTQIATIPRKLWEHPNPKSTQMWQFMQEVNEQSNRDLKVSVFFSHESTWCNIASWKN